MATVVKFGDKLPVSPFPATIVSSVDRLLHSNSKLAINIESVTDTEHYR